MTHPESVLISENLGRKYRELVSLATELSMEATMYQSSLAVADKLSRELFNAVSRIVAFGDQVQVGLNLMGEDIRVVESGSMDPVTAQWREFVEKSFEEHCSSISGFTGKVH